MPEPQLPHRRLLGRELLVRRHLGRGTYGEVYTVERVLSSAQPSAAAKSPEFPAKFAVKIISRNFSAKVHRREVMQEVETLRTLRHPFIVHYIAAWLEGFPGPHFGCICLAMHLCNGGDLYAFIQHHIQEKRMLSQSAVVRIMSHVFSALNYSHSMKVIHRDIKPANIFLSADPDNRVRCALVGDFGLARSLDRTSELAHTRVGTAMYFSPEVASCRGYSTKTDIFSAGIVFYELLTLHHPFWKRSYTHEMAVSRIIGYDPMPRLFEQLQGRVDPALSLVVQRCLSKNEADRPTAFEVLSVIQSPITALIASAGIRVWKEGGNGEVERQVPDPPIDAAAGAPPLPSAVGREEEEQNTTAIYELLRVRHPSSIDEQLHSLLHGDEELFVIVRVMMIYNVDSYNVLHLRVVRALTAIRPSIAARDVGRLMYQLMTK